MKTAKVHSWRQLSWCFALVLSLLFSQFAGQRHRIDHTRWLAGITSSANVVAQADFSGGWAGTTDATHSCIALDAATLADGMGCAILPVIPLLGSALLLPGPAFLKWDALFSAHFRSRAPPVLP
jgi:hypothetical protein